MLAVMGWLRPWLLVLCTSSCRWHFDAVDDGRLGGPRTVTAIVHGRGAVASEPAGLACIDQCGATFDGPVVLRAFPAGANGVASWSFPGCGAAPTCVVTGSNDQTVTVDLTGPPDTLGANLAFVTSGAHAGAFKAAVDPDGLDGANRFCQQTAGAAGIAGTYVAFMSNNTSARNATDQLAGGRGWVRTDGAIVYRTLADVAAGTQFHAIDLDEHGVQSGTLAWIGGNAAARAQAGVPDCQGWTSQAPADDGNLMFANDVIADRLIVSGSCDVAESVMCMGVDRAVDLPIAAFPVGRYAFVTRAKWPAIGTSLAAIDAACAADAGAAGLPGHFVAGVATSTQTISDRIGGVGGPWRRPDGILITFDALSDDLAAPIDVTATGEPQNTVVWTGSSHVDLASFIGECADWTTPNDTVSGGFGFSMTSNNLGWMDQGGYGCSFADGAFYCMQTAN